MHTDEQGVTLPDAGFAEALADAALTITHGGEQRSVVLLTMASHRQVALGLMGKVGVLLCGW